MIELLERADPAAGVEVDKEMLRAKVDQAIGLTPRFAPSPPIRKRPLLAALASAAAVTAVVAVVIALRPEPQPDVFQSLMPAPNRLGLLPGVEQVVGLESGGVKGMAIDGDTIWVLESLHHKLNRIGAADGAIEASYEIDAYAEGVVVGGGYLWLSSYDHEGEVLRFDPETGQVDLTIALGGAPGWSAWFGDSLWINNEQGDLFRITTAGAITSMGTGEVKGQGLGYLWVNDPATELISSIGPDGARGEIVIPTHPGLETMSGSGVRLLIEAAGKLWLMDGDYPWGTNLSVFDPDTGDLRTFGGVTFGLHSMIEFEGSLWLTSHTDHLLIRIDPETGEVRRYPMPGKPGGLVASRGSLWVALHHPGALLRIDPDAGLLEAGETVADDWNRFPHRLLCTGGGDLEGPTIILEPYDWIDYGSWSVVQAQLSNQGHLVCSNGYVDGEASPKQRAAALNQALIEAGISGPLVLVANGDGVHTTRLFAEARDDVVGVVLVDPMPVGFGDFLEEQAGDHPPFADLDPATSAALDFGEVPLVVVGQDPEKVFLSPQFIAGFGLEKARVVNDYWQDGLAFYRGLSTDVSSRVAAGTGMHMVIWDQPGLVVEEVLNVISRGD
jgi:sugar lactone lactonase YvrE